jgi:acetyl esterase
MSQDAAPFEMSILLNDPNLTRGVKQFLTLQTANQVPIEKLSAEQARKDFAAMQNSFVIDLSGITESNKAITSDGSDIQLTIVRPEGVTGLLPVFLFIYGGGWVIGDYQTHKRMVRDLVVLTGFSGVVVNYTPSPEAKYPQALHEIHTAAKWILGHGEEIQVNSAKMGIIGNDCGANMASATALMAKANGGPDFKVQILMCPVMSARFEPESIKNKYIRQPFLTNIMIKWMWDQYIPDDLQRKEIYASPLLATSQQLKGFPPTLIQVAENDIFRDEGEAFGRTLDNAGVVVTTVRYNGVIHDFGLLNALAELPETKSCLLHAAAELKRYLG